MDGRARVVPRRVTAPNKDLDRLYGLWSRWVREIWFRIVQARADREMWLGMLDAFERRGVAHTGTEWWKHYTTIYLHAQAMAVRRLTDDNPNSMSLPRLLGAMKSNPRVLTYERFAELWGGDVDWAYEPRNAWQRWVGDADQLDDALLDQIADRIGGSCEHIRDMVDRRVAHSDERGHEDAVTLKDIHDALETITEEFRLVALIVTAVDYNCDVHLGDWQRPFRRPLWPPLPVDLIDEP